MMQNRSDLTLYAVVSASLLTICAAVDIIKASQTIKDGETIVSASGNFELAFFSLNGSHNRYLGIRYKRISTGAVVWVSNAGNPLNDSSGVLRLTSDGRLLLLSGNNSVIWQSYQSGNNNSVIWQSYQSKSSPKLYPVAQLLDTGNLVVRNAWGVDEENVIWESRPSSDVCAGRYGLCGPYGTCNNSNSPPCGCLKGFVPRSPQKWYLADWSGGCERIKALDCNTDRFRAISVVKLPDAQGSWYNESMTLEECEMACKRNCTCTAYASLDTEGVGCSLWFGDVIEDKRGNSAGRELYLRMAASEVQEEEVQEAVQRYESKNNKVTTIVFPTSVSLLVLGLILALYIRRKKTRSCIPIKDFVGNLAQSLMEDYTNESQKEPMELPAFSLSTITNSTHNFSKKNKLGQGGFGPVYKGVLDGREIAVKRLSKTSSQGFDEFKNEVRCIAKLQHRNLVKLLGYCIQGEEFMLVYEYMPNKSLDSFIFDEVKSLKLDWPCRFKIIHGIARGLLYLHQDSPLRIIHRDLKAGNILLDLDMNPKISDFGLARRFHGHESEANTNRVVGTLGYIPPEYAVNGHFSIKTDVFSFGVLLLEIVSGKKNRGFSHQGQNDNLLAHAWRLYKAGKSLELLNATLFKSCVDFEVLRTIQIGLLCVQDNAEDRPTMSTVLSMLGGEGQLLPAKQPAFFSKKNLMEVNSSMPMVSSPSINYVTITLIDGR